MNQEEQQQMSEKSKALQSRIIDLFEELKVSDDVTINCVVNMVGHAYVSIGASKEFFLKDMSDVFDFYTKISQQIEEANNNG